MGGKRVVVYFFGDGLVVFWIRVVIGWRVEGFGKYLGVGIYKV